MGQALRLCSWDLLHVHHLLLNCGYDVTSRPSNIASNREK